MIGEIGVVGQRTDCLGQFLLGGVEPGAVFDHAAGGVDDEDDFLGIDFDVVVWLTAKKVSHWYGRRFLIFA